MFFMFWKGNDSLALKMCRKHEIGDERKLFLPKLKRKCSFLKQILVLSKLAIINSVINISAIKSANVTR